MRGAFLSVASRNSDTLIFIIMKTKNFDNAIDEYIAVRRPALRRRLSMIKSSQKISRQMLVGIGNDAYERLIVETANLTEELSRCSTREEVENLLFDNIGNTEGIGEASISLFASHYAYTHELPNESNCICALFRSTKDRIMRLGLDPNNLKEHLTEFNAKFSLLSNDEVIDFVNKCRGSISKLVTR